MVISVDKIIVKDRIRKDFGDIAELAADIKENGLINPIVVNKDYALLAGERRLRAVKYLGWPQVEVRMMDTRDAEHELNIEISENDVRKAFSKSERVDYMYRLMRIEKEKAAERQKAGVPMKSSEGGEAKDKTAEAFGIGRQTMEREMSIVEHKDLLDPKDFADWDEGKLSTNKAYQQMKARMKQLEEENQKLHGDNKILARRAEPTVIEKTVEVEVVPDDYEQAKRDAEIAKRDFRASQKQYEEMAEKWKASEREKEKLLKEKNDPEVQEAERVKLNAMSFVAGVSNFLEKFGGYSYLMGEVNALPKSQRDAVNEAVNAMNNWVSAMLNETVSEVIE